MRVKEYFLGILIGAVLLNPILLFSDNLPTVYLYYGEECPHCKAEEAFLEELKKEFIGLEIQKFEVWHNEENRTAFLEIVEKLGIKNPGVPLTVIGDKYLIGFDNPENLGQKIKQMIEGYSGYSIILQDQDIVSHPIFGKVNVKGASLPFLTVVLGTLDGFNPCSMWSLLVLLTLVIATGSHKRVWLVGSIFIITSAISYFLFLAAWLNAFILLEYLTITRVIVGIIAIFAGILSLKAFFTFKPNVCEVSSSERQQKITERIKRTVNSKNLIALILGVAVIAFSVNLIELLCSLGIPVVYTKTLAMYNLPTWKYYVYVGLYDFFYIIDDIIVLLVAGFSMRFLRLNGKYSRWSRLFAGLLMLVLGAIFLFKPELLMFD